MRPTPIAHALALAASLVFVVHAFAADIDALSDTTPKERAEAQTLMMKEKLGLGDAKLEKVRAINLKYAEKMEPVIKGSDGPLMKGREARNFQAQKEGELQGVLSPDEFKKYIAMKQEMREKAVQRIYEERGKKAQ